MDDVRWPRPPWGVGVGETVGTVWPWGGVLQEQARSKPRSRAHALTHDITIPNFFAARAGKLRDRGVAQGARERCGWVPIAVPPPKNAVSPMGDGDPNIPPQM